MVGPVNIWKDASEFFGKCCSLKKNKKYINLMYFTWLYQIHCSRMQVAANIWFTATDSSHIGTQGSWGENMIDGRQAIQKHQNLVRGTRCSFPIHFSSLSRLSLNMCWIFLFTSESCDCFSSKMPLNSTYGDTCVRKGVHRNGINLFLCEIIHLLWITDWQVICLVITNQTLDLKTHVLFLHLLWSISYEAMCIHSSMDKK